MEDVLQTVLPNVILNNNKTLICETLSWFYLSISFHIDIKKETHNRFLISLLKRLCEITQVADFKLSVHFPNGACDGSAHFRLPGAALEIILNLESISV